MISSSGLLQVLCDLWPHVLEILWTLKQWRKMGNNFITKNMMMGNGCNIGLFKGHPRV